MRTESEAASARAAALALTALLGVAQASRAAALPALAFKDTRLANGLRVIIAPDHSAPVFGVAVTYDVGSRDERPGRTGFAHLFEHMMFEGSQNVGKGEHFILILNNGGGMNGTTNEDRTNYFETLPKNQLDLALFLEADRMRSLAVTQENLDNQRHAVQEERRLGIDNQPYGKSELEIDNLSYDAFAYKHSTIGEMADLDAATLEDVKEFFRVHYAPNNAVLTLVGDLQPEEALKRVEKYFGSIPAQPSPPPLEVREPEHYGPRREVISDALARVPQLLVSYHIAPGNTPENDAFQVLEHILGAGKSSRLYQRLVKDKQLATSVSVNADARRGPSLLYMTAMVRPGVAPEEVEKALEEEIEAVRKEGVTEREIQKARTQFRRSLISQRQTDLFTAIDIGRYAVYFNDPGLINTAYARFSAVTAARVKEAARQRLVAAYRATVVTLPATASGGSP